MATGHSILISGGAGYLGSIPVPELLAASHRVTVLNNFLYEQNSLAQPRAPLFGAPRCDKLRR
jgi:UDP-glucose 4-epimerase